MPVKLKALAHTGSAAICPPSQIEPSSNSTPTIEISPMRPGR
eukprot:gene16560-19901_t